MLQNIKGMSSWRRRDGGRRGVGPTTQHDGRHTGRGRRSAKRDRRTFPSNRFLKWSPAACLTPSWFCSFASSVNNPPISCSYKGSAWSARDPGGAANEKNCSALPCRSPPFVGAHLRPACGRWRLGVLERLEDLLEVRHPALARRECPPTSDSA